MRYKRLELVSQAEGHGFESRLPLKKTVFEAVFLLFLRQRDSSTGGGVAELYAIL